MQKKYDLVIRAGLIVDGTAKNLYKGDVGVKDGVIVAIGQIDGVGAEEIDAEGLIVTPGFVDVHTHYDGQITWENQMAPSPNHGVTTVVMGNCGVGFAPVRKTDHQLVIKLMEGVEDIPEIVMANGVPWNWESFPDYLDALEKRESDVDFAAQIPHSPLRVFVMGSRGAELEPATETDLAEMRRLVAEAIDAGALGVSTSRNLFHRFRSGELAPSVKTELDELLALAGGLKDARSGVFQINPNIDTDARDELDVIRKVAEYSERPLNYSLIAVPTRMENWDVFVEGTDELNNDNLSVTAQFMPRPMGVLYGLNLSFHPFSLNPSYRTLADLPLEEKVRRMRDPELRAQIISERPEDPNPAFVSLLSMDSALYKLSEPANYNFSEEDSLQSKAASSETALREVIYDTLLEDDGRAILCSYSQNVESCMERTAPLFSKDNMVVALGDGGAHYGMICDASYTTYVMAQRIGHNGLDLPTVVKALTSQPAKSLGLQDRGVLAPGYKADINVIDLEGIVLHRPAVKTDLPANGKRLSQKSDGYVATIVSGTVTYRNGERTGALPGRLVRGAKTNPSVSREMAEV